MIEFLKKCFESQCNKEINESATDGQKNLSIKLTPVKNIKCQCKRKEGVNIVDAIKVYGDTAFEGHLKKEGFEFSSSYNTFSFTTIYKITSKGISIIVDQELGVFTKSACLSCNTCLGWKHETVSYAEYTKVNESPEEYFSRIIREHVAAEKKRISEKELALKICGENNKIV